MIKVCKPLLSAFILLIDFPFEIQVCLNGKMERPQDNHRKLITVKTAGFFQEVEADAVK